MSVEFYMMRRDIPDDCAYDVCREPGDTFYDEPKGIRVSVSYWYDKDKALQNEYPALYPDYFKGKRCKQVSYRLSMAIRKCRSKELKRYRGYYSTEDARLRRINRMLTDLSKVLQVCINHPDWKLVLES